MKILKKFLYVFFAVMIWATSQASASALTSKDVSAQYTNNIATVANSITTGEQKKSGSYIYYQSADYGLINRSWFKPVTINDEKKWFHFKNEMISNELGIKNAATFHYNKDNCSTTIKALNCTKMATSTSARISSYSALNDENETIIKYYGNTNYDKEYREDIYNAKKQLIKRITYKLNSKGLETYSTHDERKYHANGKLYQRNVKNNKWEHKSTLMILFDYGWFKQYNKKGKLTHHQKTNYLFVRAYTERRTYYSNGTSLKAKKVIVGTNTIDCRRTAIKYTEYRKNGKKKLYKRQYYKNGKKTRMNYYVYNKKGKLGAAKRVKLTKTTKNI